MTTMFRLAPLLLACATLQAAAATGYTSQADLDKLFDVEGNSPYPAPYAGTLEFSALESKYDSGHGHGYRNEMKIASKLRKPAAQTREHFSAQVTPILPDGAKSIVAQYHGEGLGTVLKVYVQDTADCLGADGKNNNGVFDILLRWTGTNGVETGMPLGTVRSGGTFGLDIRFEAGDVSIALTDADGGTRTVRQKVQSDSSDVYFKFGDYLQALDPATGQHTTDPLKWEEYYRLHHIDSSRIRFSNTVFQREGTSQ
ncbi:alginate lyase [Pseudoduganella flava]|uniref:Alginate lyase n=1 Tax=Pseudoduganella flava TaxID=871742 RepID=A0A562Q0H9_9BURK|nr:polysaccharide lyase family 7 protein [Pseudoduganella flava]QGZ38268.1 hypothetical protein GO485_03865 [Pseudoduganella flava]TWI50195.1 alginate lyase [Pseudoduganella flava]